MFVQLLLLALKGIPNIKYEKKTIDNTHFFTFFTTLHIIWPKFCPKITPTLIFFCWFQMKCQGMQLMLITNWNPIVLKKKLLKPLKITNFQPNLCKNGVPMGHAQKTKSNFFAEVTKPDHTLSKTFYFIKISYVLAKLCMFFYFVCCFFS